jgi:octaprenyl-diphosphate synthase
MARVNAAILAQVESEITLIHTVASHIIAAGGKRIRPSLTLASARLCGYEGDRHIQLAATVEFIHTATLLHDDVVDESGLRRGEATANAIWGNKSSVLVGDFLLSRAFQMMVADGALDVLKILSDTAATISAGEVQQMMVSHDLDIRREVHLEVIHAKTAALFAAACELGAVISDKPALRAPLRAFGTALGMTFQLVDDALDYQADSAALGKAIGDDFREGKVTLPVMAAYARGTADEREFWARCFSENYASTAEDLLRARQIIQAHEGVKESLRLAREFADEAHLCLRALPAGLMKDALSETVDFSLNRHY